MVTVYGLRRPGEDVRYIGQTKTPVKDRLRRHYTAAKCGSPYPVHRWMRKHDDIEVIVIVDDAVMDADEEAAIQVAKDAGLRLLNCTSGGRGMMNLSEEAKAKIGAIHRGVPKSAEQKAKMSAAHKGRPRVYNGRSWSYVDG